MKELNALVEQENKWSTILGKKPLDLNSAKDRQEIAEIIDYRLSPENLCCDGELSSIEVNRRYRQLSRAAEQLRNLDSSVTFYEIF